MADKGIQFRVDPGTFSNVLRVVEGMRLKDLSKQLSELHFGPLIKLKNSVLAAAPRDKQFRLKIPMHFVVVDVKDNRTLGYVGGLMASYTSDAFIARFVEKGTKVRQGRGKIVARRFIEKTHTIHLPMLIKQISINYQNFVYRRLQSLNKNKSKI